MGVERSSVGASVDAVVFEANRACCVRRALLRRAPWANEESGPSSGGEEASEVEGGSGSVEAPCGGGASSSDIVGGAVARDGCAAPVVK